jgi:flagellar protein FliO/FliZ
MKRKQAIFVLPIMVLLINSGTIGRGQDTISQEPAAGQTQSAQESTLPEMSSFTESVLPSLARIALTLVLIIIFIYVTVFFLRKLSGARGVRGGRGQTIQIIEQAHLSPRKSICLVRLADRAVLVGITENNINMLTEFDAGELPVETVRKSTNGQSFSAILSGAAQKMLGRKEAGR